MNGGWKLVVVLGLMFVGALGLWMWTSADNKALLVRLGQMQSVIDANQTANAQLDARIKLMEKHVEESNRVLAAVELLKAEVYNARKQTEQQLSKATEYLGNDRIDYLVRLLDEDRDRRKAPASANGADESVH